MNSTTTASVCITYWVKGLELVFADVNKQMGIITNHSPWSVLNRDLDTLKRRVASVVVIRFCRARVVRYLLNQKISLRKVSPKLRGAPAPGATPLPTPMHMRRVSPHEARASPHEARASRMLAHMRRMLAHKRSML